jgi:hypothetical protein
MSQANWGGPFCIAALFCDQIDLRDEHGTRNIYSIHNRRRINSPNEETTIQFYTCFVAGRFNGTVTEKLTVRFLGERLPVYEKAITFVAGNEFVDERNEFTLDLVPGIYLFDLHLGTRFMTTIPLSVELRDT